MVMIQNEKAQKLLEKIDAIIERNRALDAQERCKHSMREYVTYLKQWLRTHNVVSRKNNDDDIWINMYDSLVVLENEQLAKILLDFDEQEIVDAGAGGGFPGIPLAIVLREKRFLLVDANRKKCSFLRAVKSKLDLQNISVLNGRIQDSKPSRITITKAAFSPPHIGVLADTIMKGGILLIWASDSDREEFQRQLERHGIQLKARHNYSLPSHPQRSLLLFEKEE